MHTENGVLVDKIGRLRGVYNATLPTEINRMIEDLKILTREKQ
ncbi:hypothetical protein [Aquimarina pacifica]|nr:hypothetical protein [Aquimarina pacifica]